MSKAFKVGVISLVFLIIGFQTALLVSRASILHIEANRDKPDTVYVIAQAIPEQLSPKSESETGHSSKPEPAKTIRKTEKRYAEHSEVVKEIRAATRKVETFSFNPNTVSLDDLQRLGFSEKQAQSIINYRTKGGKFRRKSDFAKSYVVADSVYSRLEPFIEIPKLDINLADSTQLDELPGIGPYFAAKIIEYRNKLGGYSYIEQLMDIRNFDQDKFDGLSDLIECSLPEAPFAIWSLPSEELLKHPYISNSQIARAIVLYRENHTAEELTIDGLLKAGILSEENAGKLGKCHIADAE